MKYKGRDITRQELDRQILAGKIDPEEILKAIEETIEAMTEQELYEITYIPVKLDEPL